MKVGVTVFIRDRRQSLWENGIHQNALFLLMLIARSPIVSQGFVVHTGPMAAGIGAEFGAPAIDLTEAMSTLDLVIELGAHVPADWAGSFRARGGRIIAMRVANDFVIDMECAAHDRPPGQLVFGVTYDRIWTLPAFARTCAPYYANVLRAPVRVMPHLWHPRLIDGAGWGYRPNDGPWRVAIMEPNVASAKTSHVPMLVCEQVWRRQPQAFEAVRVYNADRFRKGRYFAQFAASLDIVRQGIATFAPRYRTGVILRDHACCVVSHHTENAQNYLYYEALHGGYPLIHNSAMLGDCGYRYRDLDCDDGARVLIAAIAGHDADLARYRARGHAFLDTLDPCATANVAAYSAAIADCVTD